jgi:hypothetical protein
MATESSIQKNLDMTNIERIEASAATQAATGITHYVVDATNGWKAFGANDAEIATHVVAKEARGKGVLRVDTHDRRVEITYSIEGDGNNIVIVAVVNGIPSKVAFSKDGGLIGEGLKKTVDPAIHEMFRSIVSDLMALRGARRGATKLASEREYYCGGLLDAIEGARRAGEWLAQSLLSREWANNCV